MTIPTNNISASLINQELGNAPDATFDVNSADPRFLASVGGDGAQTSNDTPIAFSQFRDRAIFKLNYNSNATDVVISTGSYSPGKTYGIVTIGPGVAIGASSTGQYSMNIQGSSGDIIRVQNSGSIVGHGGDGGGEYGRGADGGPALLVQGGTTLLYNVGIIGGGGGGGGGGGAYEDRQRPRERSGGGGGGGGGGYYAGAGGPHGGWARSYRPQDGQAGQAVSPFSGGGGGGGVAYVGGTGGSLGQGGGGGVAGGGGSNGGAAIQGIDYVQIAQVGTISGSTG